MIQDVSKLKVGDKCWCIQLGDCVVKEDVQSDCYSFRVAREGRVRSYTQAGKYYSDDVFQSLFLTNPFLFPSFPKIDGIEWIMKEMEVSDDEEDWSKYFVVAKLAASKNFVVFDDGDSWEWLYAREVQQTSSKTILTIEEIEKKLSLSPGQLLIKDKQ